MYRYAYISADLIMAIIWIFLFFRRKDLRKEICIMSILSLVWIALSFTFFVPDWSAVYLAPETLMPIRKGMSGEDAIYAIVFGGIAAVLYEEFLGKKHLKKMRQQNAFTVFALFPILIFVGLYICTRILHINAYWGSYTGFLLASGYIWLWRKDLFFHSIMSGILLMLAYFIAGELFFLPFFPGIVAHWWHFETLSKILIFGIPLEELVWAFFFGLFMGPVYEFLMGLRDVPLKALSKQARKITKRNK